MVTLQTKMPKNTWFQYTNQLITVMYEYHKKQNEVHELISLTILCKSILSYLFTESWPHPRRGITMHLPMNRYFENCSRPIPFYPLLYMFLSFLENGTQLWKIYERSKMFTLGSRDWTLKTVLNVLWEVVLWRNLNECFFSDDVTK